MTDKVQQALQNILAVLKTPNGAISLFTQHSADLVTIVETILGDAGRDIADVTSGNIIGAIPDVMTTVKDLENAVSQIQAWMTSTGHGVTPPASPVKVTPAPTPPPFISGPGTVSSGQTAAK